jgi:hypothetical protein
MAVLRAGNTKICLLEKRAGTRASTHIKETRRYERHWTPVHLDIHVGDLEAALAGRLPSAAIRLAMASVSYRGTDSRVGQARGRESFPTVSPMPLENANWRQATGLLGRKPCGSGIGPSRPISHLGRDVSFGGEAEVAGRQSSLPRSRMTHSDANTKLVNACYWMTSTHQKSAAPTRGACSTGK